MFHGMITALEMKQKFSVFMTTPSLTSDYRDLVDEIVSIYEFNDTIAESMVSDLMFYTFLGAQQAFMKGRFDVMDSSLNAVHEILKMNVRGFVK